MEVPVLPRESRTAGLQVVEHRHAATLASTAVTEDAPFTIVPSKPVVTDAHSHEVPQGGSIPAAVFGIVKAMVGPAILYLPHSFADAGYAFALIALFGTTAMYLFSSNRLLDSWKVQGLHRQQNAALEKKRVKNRDNNAGGVEMVSLLKLATMNPKETGGESETVNPIALPNGTNMTSSSFNDNSDPPNKPLSFPQLARDAYGTVGETCVRIGIASMQLGVCLTYFIFVPHNLSVSMNALFNLDIPLWMCLMVMMIIEIPLSSIRDIRKLTTTNVIANGLIFFGLMACLWLALTYDRGDAPNPQRLSPLNSRWYLFLGTSVLLFEGSITLCLPLQESVQGEKERMQFPSVYATTISSIVVFYIFFGLACWTAFGDEVNTVLTTSLPEGNFATTVQLAYSLAVIFTFPLQAFPALDIIYHSVASWDVFLPTTDGELLLWQRLTVVSVVISLLSVVAVVEMDNLGRVVSLMGALLGCPLAFVFPPLIHNRLVLEAGEQTSPTQRLANNTVAGLGLLCMVGATCTTLATWNEEGERRRLFVAA